VGIAAGTSGIYLFIIFDPFLLLVLCHPYSLGFGFIFFGYSVALPCNVQPL
jgi:hypothetical protein